MDLNTVECVTRPRCRDELPVFARGDAYLAGGTWMFSEPQTHLRRLIDLSALAWPPIICTSDGLEVAATCTLAELETFEMPPEWAARVLLRQCCMALLGSFKIRAAATVGGNLCLALPAAPMAALAVALDGRCTIWGADGATRVLPAADLIIGPQRTVLMPGEILRSIAFPQSALRRRVAFRQASLTQLGRSASLLVGTCDEGGVTITITASVPRPVQVFFAGLPGPTELTKAILAAVPSWLDDIHGSPAWRTRITLGMAREICAELSSP